MTTYYSRTFMGMGVVFAVVLVAAVLANSIASEAKARYQVLVAQDAASGRAHAIRQQESRRLRSALNPVHEFAAAWKPHARLPEKEAAERIRSEIETIAQRQLGLVTDGAITPQPEKYLFQGTPLRVQRVSLRASGKDLPALITWLGKVEERYPAALVEQCEFSSNVGGNTGLTIRLVQPLTEPISLRGQGIRSLPDSGAVIEAAGAITWPRYFPGIVKSPLAVGFQRNPLQPAVMADQRPIVMPHDSADEVTPRLEMALDGRVRSVVRGALPIIVVDGRIFRIGDEVVLGPNRERPLADAKTKLKAIGDEQLVFQVAGGTADRNVQCEVTYTLPAFLKAR